MTASPVIGVDLGNESCFIAVARAGGIEVLINDYSTRDTPCCVGFTSKNRVIGTSAKNQLITNINSTVFAFKRLIGLRFEDPLVAEEQRHLSYTLIRMPDGEVGFRVWYLGEETTFGVRQVVAMLLTKLKDIAEQALECKVYECVIAVPYFFTDAQRRALLDAASIANLTVLRLLNEPSAAAVAYGLYRTSTVLPNADQPPRHVAFVDFGASALQVALAAFHKGKVKMLATTFDATVGGRSFNALIAAHLAAPFNRPNSDVTKNKRAWLRLLTDVDKLKRQMSANVGRLPVNIECLIDERDFSGAMQRQEMEELCAPLLQRVRQTLQRCLDASGLSKDDVSEIELIGGSTRMPSVKALIEDVFGKPPSTTLNQDECVARGAAIMGAMLSPNFKVREFALTDLQPYAMTLSWGGEADADAEKGQLEVFPKFHAVPFSKLLTFYRKAPFVVSAHYSDPEVGAIQPVETAVGHFHIQGVKPGASGEAQKVKVKVRLNLHGAFQVVSATMMEKQGGAEASLSVASSAADADADAMETDAAAGASTAAADAEAAAGAADDASGADATPADADAASKMETDASGADKAAAPAPKQLVKAVELLVESRTSSAEASALQLLTEREHELQAQDRQERDRIDSKNALEEFVLAIRGRIHDDQDLAPYLEPATRDQLARLSDDTENWLYDDGEDCEKALYTQKLQEVQALANPAVSRKRDHEGAPRAAEQLAAVLNRAQKALASHRAGDALYDHWTGDEASKLERAIGDKKQWLDANASRVRATAKTADLPVKPAAFAAELQSFEVTFNAVLNKKKPAPAPAPSEKPAEETATPPPSSASGSAPPPASNGDKMETE